MLTLSGVDDNEGSDCNAENDDGSDRNADDSDDDSEEGVLSLLFL